MTGDSLGTLSERNIVFKVLRCVFLVGDDTPVSVKLSLCGSPAHCVKVGNNSMYRVRRKKPVLNALFEAVLIDRVAKMGVGITVIIPKWGCRHAQLVRGFKICKYFPPI